MQLEWSEASLEQAEQARCAAMIAGDEAALRGLFAAEATWTHSSGQVDDRDAFIAKIVSGASTYLTIERGEVSVRIYGSVAIASGVATMAALAHDETRSLRNRYTNVWALAGGRAVLVSAQSTKLA